MAPADARAWVHGQMVLRKQPMPGPPLAQRRILALDRERHLHAWHVACAVAFEHLPAGRELSAQGLHERPRQHRDAILATLPGPHRYLAALEVDVLYPKREALGDTHSRAVHE